MTTSKVQDQPLNSTMFKNFTSYSDLINKTSGLLLNIEIANVDWCVPVTKKSLKKVADSMRKQGHNFTGTITYAGGGQKWAQIKMSK